MIYRPLYGFRRLFAYFFLVLGVIIMILQTEVLKMIYRPLYGEKIMERLKTQRNIHLPRPFCISLMPL